MYKNKGTRIIMQLRNGLVINGELLAVRDTGLVIARKDNYIRSGLGVQKESIIIVNNKEISLIRIPDKSKTLNIVGGIIGGLLLGASIGIMTYNEPKPSISSLADLVKAMLPVETIGELMERTILFSLIGGGIGTIVGIVASADEEIKSESDFNFLSLKDMARFPDAEPPYIQNIK